MISLEKSPAAQKLASCVAPSTMTFVRLVSFCLPLDQRAILSCRSPAQWSMLQKVPSNTSDELGARADLSPSPEALSFVVGTAGSDASPRRVQHGHPGEQAVMWVKNLNPTIKSEKVVIFDW